MSMQNILKTLSLFNYYTEIHSNEGFYDYPGKGFSPVHSQNDTFKSNQPQYFRNSKPFSKAAFDQTSKVVYSAIASQPFPNQITRELSREERIPGNGNLHIRREWGAKYIGPNPIKMGIWSVVIICAFKIAPLVTTLVLTSLTAYTSYKILNAHPCI